MSAKKTTKSNFDKLNDELNEMGIDTVDNVDLAPERTAYFHHLEEGDREDKDFLKKLKFLKNQHKINFHKWVAKSLPYLRFEIGEDKTYWNYSDETGVYDEMNFGTVRGIVMKMMIDDGLETEATEGAAKTILYKYRAMFADRGSHYDDFDADGNYFHAANGWVQVHTREFEEHTPERLSRRVSAVDYDKDATCPVYDKFLDEQVQLQKDQVKVIDQFSGLLLTPDITRQKMLVLIGKPGSGKSTLLDCWADILGDVAVQKGLSEISGDSFRFGGSSLVGKRLCWFDEVEVTRSEMGNSLIQLITGQHINVERKGINGIIQADNQLKCVITANTLPRSAEMGVYRRMILIYLEYSFYDNMTADHNIRTTLQAEASGILNRMLDGLADLEKHDGFTMIEGHDDLIEEYKTSSNTVAEFLDEYFVFDEKAEPITTKVLLEAYKDFSTDRYSDSLTPQRFGMLMKHHGLTKFNKIYAKKDSSGAKVWCGLQLREGLYTKNTMGYIRPDENGPLPPSDDSNF